MVLNTILFFLFSGLGFQLTPNLTISGVNFSFADSSKVYLFDAQSRALVDSTIILNKSFKMIRTQEVDEQRFVLRVFDGSWATMIFWSNAGEIIIDAKNENPKSATITGSPSQDLLELFSKVESVNDFNELFNQNQKSLVSYYSLYGKILGKEIERTDAMYLFSMATETIRESPLGKQIQKQLADLQKPKIGDKYVDFSLPDTAGNVITLSKSLGKVTLLEFWGSWCTKCRIINPELKKIYSKFHGSGLEIVGIAIESEKKAWKNAIESERLPWIHVSDLSGRESFPVLVYAPTETPYNVLIDSEGKIIGENIELSDLEKKLAELLK